MTAYATRDEIVEAITRANFFKGTTDTDGTYTIIPAWIGRDRVWMAERIVETDGYEVAYDASLPAPNLHIIEGWERWGMWTNPETGEVCLDRTVHIHGVRAGVALDLARLYKQDAIYDWASGECIPTTDPATAL